VTSLQAVWSGPGRPIELVTASAAELQVGEALLAVELTTICGSDLHTVAGRRPAATPLVLGHEIVGRVVALGPGTPLADVRGRRVMVGDRLVPGIFAACGVCDRCRRGLPEKCRTLMKYGHTGPAQTWPLTGGFAEQLHVRRGTPVVVVPERLPGAVAATVGCAVATAVSVAAAARPAAGWGGVPVTVAGAGLVGLLAAALLVRSGAVVTVLEPAAVRWAGVRAVGAEPLEPSAAEPDSAEVFLELSGSAAAVAAAPDITAVGGTVVLAGTVSPGVEIRWPAETVVRRLLTVRGVHNYRPEHLAEAAAWMEHSPELWPLFDGPVFPLADLDSALVEAGRGAALRVAVRPGC
jgi:putative phosphonate catabolism associated alcohol dehydrogenase